MNGSTPTQVTQVTSDDQFSSELSALTSDALLVLYFHAPWAAPCAQMSTVLETLAATYPYSQPATIRFLSVDAEELPDISEDYDVSAVPYIVLQRDGNTLDTISGGDAAKLRAAVEKHHGAPTRSGSAQLPPAQQVTRPEQQPIPETTAAASNRAIPAIPQTNGNAPSAAKNLSAYTPDKSDPQSNGNAEPQDLHARLTQLVKAAPVMLFMKGTPSAPQCGFSRQLVGILREKSVRYGFFNILADEDVRQGLKEFADWPTFPQLWMGGELVGGLDIVREEMENDPSFFADYAVDTTKKTPGGLPSAEAPTATA